MTHTNLLGWLPLPDIKAGDVIDGGSLTLSQLPTDVSFHIEKAIIVGKREDCPSNITLGKSVVFVIPDEPQPIDQFTALKEQAKEKLLEVKPIAYENPLAVKTALGEAFTTEEFNGVMEAN